MRSAEIEVSVEFRVKIADWQPHTCKIQIRPRIRIGALCGTGARLNLALSGAVAKLPRDPSMPVPQFEPGILSGIGQPRRKLERLVVSYGVKNLLAEHFAGLAQETNSVHAQKRRPLNLHCLLPPPTERSTRSTDSHPARVGSGRRPTRLQRWRDQVGQVAQRWRIAC